MARGKRASRGTDASDLHRYERRGWYEHVDDDRQGKTLCRKCSAEVTTVEVDGKWQTRDLDGTPHKLTCGQKQE